MDKNQLFHIIEDAYKGLDGYRISEEGQNALGYYFLGYEYGESKFDSFYKILEKAKPNHGEVFYDLGSGLGKKVLMASLGFPFKSAIGIEAVPTLHHAAQKILEESTVLKNLHVYNKSIQLFNG